MEESSTVDDYTRHHTPPPQPIIDAAVVVARAGQVEELASLIRDHPNLAHSTYVHWAALEGKGGIPIYQLLIDGGCDIDASFEFIGSPLINAIYHNKFPLAQHLLSLGANPNINTRGLNLGPLGVATRFRPGFVVHLLDAGVDIQNTGALHIAAIKGDIETMQLLLDRGAKVNEVTKYPFYAMVGFHGRCPPLHWAIQGGHLEAVTLLLQYPVRLDIADEDGLTAIDRAKARGFGAAKDALRIYKDTSIARAAL
ncbi:uncharacterized protein GIQ15_00921 [Arthroderma uncinatum]|uniref:uncharacterized protein n=1 Tax=Arthroderma uncinatum TaxID=74035 RepID=UPI00144AB9F3|nr:uncharacterized protein GIQ15_00921 [Arthroderma uncinatum]KAF3491404.1 hypothetical protein GIQ15_00921 [Arthroderma uncinatum]